MDQPDFQRLYDKSTPAEVSSLEHIVQSANKENFINWINNHSSRDLGELSIRQLRDRASKYHVVGYSRLDKSNLIRRIREAVCA